MTDEVKKMMVEDSKDLLDNIDVTNLAEECQKLKDLEDRIKSADNHLRDLKAQADEIGSKVIPEILAEQGLSSELNLLMDQLCQLKKNIDVLFLKMKIEEQQPINGFATIS